MTLEFELGFEGVDEGTEGVDFGGEVFDLAFEEELVFFERLDAGVKIVRGIGHRGIVEWVARKGRAGEGVDCDDLRG